MVDPYMLLHDPRTGIPLPSDDTAPTATPQAPVQDNTPAHTTAPGPSQATRPLQALGVTRNATDRVQKRTPAAKRKRAGNEGIFKDFYKNNPIPYILPIEPSPSNRPVQRPIPTNAPFRRPTQAPPTRPLTRIEAVAGVENARQGVNDLTIYPTPHPEAAALSEGLKTVAVDSETAKKIPPKIPRPRNRQATSIFMKSDRVNHALRQQYPQVYKKQGRNEKEQGWNEKKQGGEEEKLFVE